MRAWPRRGPLHVVVVVVVVVVGGGGGGVSVVAAVPGCIGTTVLVAADVWAADGRRLVLDCLLQRLLWVDGRSRRRLRLDHLESPPHGGKGGDRRQVDRGTRLLAVGAARRRRACCLASPKPCFGWSFRASGLRPGENLVDVRQRVALQVSQRDDYRARMRCSQAPHVWAVARAVRALQGSRRFRRALTKHEADRF